MRFRGLRASILGLAILVVLVLGSADKVIASEQIKISAETRAALLKYATRVATIEGDPHPYDIQAVSTTSASASKIVCGGCATSPGQEPVYILAMRGHFRCNTCRTRPNGRRYLGYRTVIALVLTAEPLQQTTFSISDRYPNLNYLGTPVRLDKRRQ